ncbi:MAG: response regulator [Eubacteriales bacterium]|nr:response regulator [Eubacteriales bacterium]
MKKILDSLPCATAVFSCDKQGVLTREYISEYAKKVTGRDDLQTSQMDEIMSIVHPEDKVWVQDMIRECVADRSGMDAVYRVVNLNGKISWLHHVSNAIPQPDGSCKFYAIYTDVTAQKLMEEEKKRSYIERYGAYLKQGFDAANTQNMQTILDLQDAVLSGISNGYLVIYIINLQDHTFMRLGSIQNVNEIIKRFHDAQSAMNTVVDRLVRPEYQEKMREFVDLRTLPGRLTDRTLITYDYKGSLSGWCCAQFMPVSYDTDGSLKEVIYAVQHIQDRKLESLVYQNALESNAAFIFHFDLTEGILGEDFRPVARKLVRDFSDFSFPMEYDQFISESYKIIKARPLENKDFKFTREEMLKRYGMGETRFRAEYYAEAYDRFFGDEFFLIPNEENGHIIAMAVGSDITVEHRKEEAARKTLENALREAERANNAKTDFLSRVSHDMRTPINGVMGMLHILKENIDDKEKVLECIGKIEEAGSQLKYMINDVLDLSHIESGKIELQYETFQLAELITALFGSFQILADEKGVVLIPPGCDFGHAFVTGSPTHLSRIITNITTNAVKYTPVGGRVESFVSEKPLDEKHIWFEITIKDTGIGMSKEFLSKIYEPFARENQALDIVHDGTGLGMTITKELVTLMHGDIVIESAVGLGTTVTVGIPLEIADGAVHKEKAEKETYCIDGKRMLLVEDNEMNQEIAKYILNKKGVCVDTAINGRMAVEMFQNSAPGTYDFILMDLMMPVMNGLDATRRIRQSAHADAKTIPILATSANAFVDDIKACMEAGMNDHIAKPLDIHKMMATISKYL